MTILLFGGSGRLGTAMERILSPRHNVISPGREALETSEALETLIKTHHPDAIINTIAYNQVDKAEEIPAEAYQINAELPARLAKASAAAHIPFFHFSTDYVFEGANPKGYRETDTPNPINVYGLSKRKGEEEVLAHDPNAYILRTSRLYGAPARSPNAKRSFVEIILADAAQAETVPVLDQEISSPTYVDDVVRHLEEHLLSFPAPGIYHLANTEGATWRGWAEEIIKNAGLATKIIARDPNSLSRPAKRPQHSMLLNTKLPPMRSWQAALADFMAHKQ